jgi:Flp pilus assembly protein TadG
MRPGPSRLRRLLGLHDGATAVEAAFVLGIVLMVVFAILEFSLFWHAEHVVEGAVQDGARVASAEDGTLDDGIQRAQQLLHAGLGNAAGDVQVSALDGGEKIAIQAQGQWRIGIPFAVTGSLPLQARSVMSKEHFRAGPGHS